MSNAKNTKLQKPDFFDHLGNPCVIENGDLKRLIEPAILWIGPKT